MIRAPSEIRWSMPKYSMPMKVIARTSGMTTTIPARRPRLTKLTARTMNTASFSALVKPATDSSTTTDWLATR